METWDLTMELPIPHLHRPQPLLSVLAKIIILPLVLGLIPLPNQLPIHQLQLHLLILARILQPILLPLRPIQYSIPPLYPPHHFLLEAQRILLRPPTTVYSTFYNPRIPIPSVRLARLLVFLLDHPPPRIPLLSLFPITLLPPLFLSDKIPRRRIPPLFLFHKKPTRMHRPLPQLLSPLGPLSLQLLLLRILPIPWVRILPLFQVIRTVYSIQEQEILISELNRLIVLLLSRILPPLRFSSLLVRPTIIIRLLLADPD